MQSIKDTESKLDNYIDISIKLLKVNSSSSLTETRKSLEYLCKSIHQMERIQLPKNKDGFTTLYDMIVNLINKHKIRSIIYYKMHSIRSEANVATHDNPYEVNDWTAQNSLNDFLEIVLWFSIKYKLSEEFKKKVEAKLQSQNKIKIISLNTSLEETLSNPHYYNDLDYLEENNYSYKKLISNGILIVTGTSINAELLDRPVAEILRDEIELKYSSRAIVISDTYYFADKLLKTYPVISIGDKNNNRLTAEIIQKGEQWRYMNTYGAYYNNEIQMVALWGNSATNTRITVDRYILQDEGLLSFMNTVI